MAAPTFSRANVFGSKHKTLTHSPIRNLDVKGFVALISYVSSCGPNAILPTRPS